MGCCVSSAVNPKGVNRAARTNAEGGERTLFHINTVPVPQGSFPSTNNQSEDLREKQSLPVIIKRRSMSNNRRLSKPELDASQQALVYKHQSSLGDGRQYFKVETKQRTYSESPSRHKRSLKVLFHRGDFKGSFEMTNGVLEGSESPSKSKSLFYQNSLKKDIKNQSKSKDVPKDQQTTKLKEKSRGSFSLQVPENIEEKGNMQIASQEDSRCSRNEWGEVAEDCNIIHEEDFESPRFKMHHSRLFSVVVKPESLGKPLSITFCKVDESKNGSNHSDSQFLKAKSIAMESQQLTLGNKSLQCQDQLRSPKARDSLGLEDLLRDISHPNKGELLKLLSEKDSGSNSHMKLGSASFNKIDHQESLMNNSDQIEKPREVKGTRHMSTEIKVFMSPPIKQQASLNNEKNKNDELFDHMQHLVKPESKRKQILKGTKKLLGLPASMLQNETYSKKSTIQSNFMGREVTPKEDHRSSITPFNEMQGTKILADEKSISFDPSFDPSKIHMPKQEIIRSFSIKNSSSLNSPDIIRRKKAFTSKKNILEKINSTSLPISEAGQ